MGLDWEKNGRCRFSIMDEEILPARFCFALPKGSPHAHFINLGYTIRNSLFVNTVGKTALESTFVWL